MNLRPKIQYRFDHSTLNTFYLIPTIGITAMHSFKPTADEDGFFMPGFWNIEFAFLKFSFTIMIESDKL